MRQQAPISLFRSSKVCHSRKESCQTRHHRILCVYMLFGTSLIFPFFFFPALSSLVLRAPQLEDAGKRHLRGSPNGECREQAAVSNAERLLGTVLGAVPGRDGVRGRQGSRRDKVKRRFRSMQSSMQPSCVLPSRFREVTHGAD